MGVSYYNVWGDNQVAMQATLEYIPGQRNNIVIIDSHTPPATNWISNVPRVLVTLLVYRHRNMRHMMIPTII